MTREHDELVRTVFAVDEPCAAVVMAELLRSGRLAPAVAVEFVARAWDATPWPMAVLPRERWVALFRAAGYTHEFEPAAAPEEPLWLFRGSDEAGAEGMCWTSNLDVALWFAARFDEGWVWRARVEPWRLLAFMAETYEDQHVIDTTDLVLEVVAGPGDVAAVDVDALTDRLDALVERRHLAGVP